MYYTYAHYRADNNAIFYIGKGKDKRHLSNNRSKEWRDFTSEHAYYSQILAYWAKESDAYEHEKFLILTFKEMGYTLINKTIGGGGSGMPCSIEKAEKIRQAKLGKKQPNISKAKKGISTGKHSDERKNNISKSLKGYVKTEEHRDALSKSLKGKNTGRAPWNKGLSLSDEQKSKLNLSGLALGRQINLQKIKEKKNGKS